MDSLPPFLIPELCYCLELKQCRVYKQDARTVQKINFPWIYMYVSRPGLSPSCLVPSAVHIKNRHTFVIFALKPSDNIFGRTNH